MSEANRRTGLIAAVGYCFHDQLIDYGDLLKPRLKINQSWHEMNKAS